MSIWDDPEIRGNDDFVKLEREGQKISGVIVYLRRHRFDDGSVAPQVTYTDDETKTEKTWTAGQIQARVKLSELRPDVGDWFCAELTRIEKRGTKTLKHIDIEVRRGSGPAPAAKKTSDHRGWDEEPPF